MNTLWEIDSGNSTVAFLTSQNYIFIILVSCDLFCGMHLFNS